jgi:hypothetical protein
VLPLFLLLSGCAGPGMTPLRPIDLLKLIDTARDAVEGAWSFEGSILVTANAKFARIQIPQVPHEE